MQPTMYGGLSALCATMFCALCLSSAFLPRATDAAAPVKKMPPFSWSTVPVFVHMCNATGPFNDTAIDFLNRFAMITIEKGQGMNESDCCAEDKILAAAKQIREKNPNAYTIFYYNSVLDWNMYRLHQQMLEHPEFWMRNASGQPIRLPGDRTFPQPPEGMLVFDFTTQGGRDFWANECINMTKTGLVDGCFSDRSNEDNLPGLNSTQQQAYSTGHTQVLEQLQDAIPGTLIVNNFNYPTLNSTMIEDFDSSNDSLHRLMNITAQGKLVQVHAGYAGVEKDTYCHNITNTLASFLIAAEQYSYYGCSRGWYFKGWDNWHEEYSRPLGAPLGKATLQGTVWTRRFESGTVATYDEASETGDIQWANERQDGSVPSQVP